MEVITRADGSVHVRLDTTPVKPKARAPVVDRYAQQEAEDARRREAAERMEARRRARCSPKPPRTRAVDRLCARDGLRFTHEQLWILGVSLGGIGSPYGAMLGAVLVGLAEEFTVLVLPSTYKVGVGFVIIALLLLFRPQGLLGVPQVKR